MLLWGLAFGLAAAWTAAELGRARSLWFVFGAILGPVALLLLRAAPPAHCRSCGSPTRGWLKICWWCRQSVFGSTNTTARTVGPATQGSPRQASPRLELAGRAEPPRSLRERLEASPGLRVSPGPVPPRGEVSSGPAVPPRLEVPREVPRELPQDEVPPVRSPRPASGSIRTRRSPRSAGPATGVLPAPEARSPVASRGGPGDLPTETTPTTTRGDQAAGPPIGRLADSTGMLATAVYVAGSTSLQSGYRYGIAIRESRLQILGPTEVQPERVALDRPLAGLDARSVEGRLIVADPTGLVLAFMAVAGPSTRDLATTITEAARGGSEP